VAKTGVINNAAVSGGMISINGVKMALSSSWHQRAALAYRRRIRMWRGNHLRRGGVSAAAAKLAASGGSSNNMSAYGKWAAASVMN